MVNIFLYVLSIYYLYILMQKQLVLDTLMLSPSVFYPVFFKNKDILLPNHILITTYKAYMDSVIWWFSHLALVQWRGLLCPLEEETAVDWFGIEGNTTPLWCGFIRPGKPDAIKCPSCHLSGLGGVLIGTTSSCSGCLCGPAHTERMIVVWGTVAL